MSPLQSALCSCLLFVPFSASLADDQESQQLHTNPYQQYEQSGCSDTTGCSLSYPAMTHITTLLSNITCYLTVDPGTAILYIQIGSGQDPRAFVQPYYYGTADGWARYGVNASMNLFVAQHMQPRVDVATTGGSITNLSCTLSGYHS